MYKNRIDRDSYLHSLLAELCHLLVWGIDDQTHEIVGTDFKHRCVKKGNEELESWLLRLFNPKIEFRFFELLANDQPVVILEINCANHEPVKFKGTAYIRIGSYKKRLKDFPEKERKLWRLFDKTPF
ncbi:ATP-binding protein [Candidatus Marithrix sp. Canyon 246]|uniref:ATP-binding protein n=1 Tax=Candidatus Marithrix sp. Canyon 246 TaxID=1827136 RepID=UPI00084A14B4|nr:ATP-binding protein [Candidatus Marithrix sp. Canyon 246]